MQGLLHTVPLKKHRVIYCQVQTCVVIGSGGLGHIGIQVLRAMCAAEIIVVDPSEMALKLAEACGLTTC